MPKAWIRERKRDHYYRKAKEEKYRSRATYKLLQANRKYRFLGKGDVVIDLGAAPGGWLQASHRIVGDEGFVIGVDLGNIQPLEASNVSLIVGDIRNPKTHDQIEDVLPSQADVVVSDVSPNVSGVWEVDHARQIYLAQKSLAIALKFLKVGGAFFVKVFQGEMLQEFIEEVQRHFVRVEVTKPKASRPRSAEAFVLGLGLRNRPPVFLEPS